MSWGAADLSSPRRKWAGVHGAKDATSAHFPASLVSSLNLGRSKACPGEGAASFCESYPCSSGNQSRQRRKMSTFCFGTVVGMSAAGLIDTTICGMSKNRRG